MCCGDFNESLYNSDKDGSSARPPRQMLLFANALQDYGLTTLPYVGPKFTWQRTYGLHGCVKERLDRCVANKAWFDLFPQAFVDHLSAPVSDHAPICLALRQKIKRQQRRFRFEAMWLSHEECESTIHHSWSSAVGGWGMEKLTGKIDRCGVALSQWHKATFGNIQGLLHSKYLELSRLEALDSNSGVVEKISNAKKELNVLLEREEIFWKQRSRINWLKEGDENTKFFHARATQRFRKNNIRGLMDDLGNWQSNAESISTTAINYFESLFTSSTPNLDDLDSVLDSVPTRVTPDMNTMLDQSFSEEEIRTALSQMSPLKAPGPDGLPPVFFQKMWSIVGSEVTEAALDCLNNGQDPSALNHTYITLIPKKNDPLCMADYRPISLCNVVYKLVAKTLANRLKKILPLIISENQSTFVPGRLIVDNVLVAYEAFHHMKNWRGGKEGLLDLKLDISKAYDRVEWIFLEHIMRKLGFSNRWIKIVLSCVSTVSYSILINGEPKGRIIPSRGLRQGDPLSPYLFILCAEGLSSLIQAATNENFLHGVVVARGAPKISHLFFADDSLLFCKANI